MSEHESREGPLERIGEKLSAIAEAISPTPQWYRDWLALGPAASDEQLLAVFQAIRNSGDLPDDAGFFLVSWQIDELAACDAETALADYERRLNIIETAYGFDECGIWPAGAAPAGYQELREECDRQWDRLFVERMEQSGEHEMARLFQTDDEQFEAVREAGRQFFFGSQTPEDIAALVWIRRLVAAVADCIDADSAMGPLGYRYFDDHGCWMIDLYPTPVELIGGAADGEIVAPGFALDLDQLQSAFDEIDAFSWSSLGFPHDEGPRVIVEGVYDGRDVFLQILAYAPEDEEPGMKLNTIRRNS
ncbi:MAG: hypothetical protein HUU20_22410 [Pirellulales bacterium]|nr:hypothetical protein [Pirellulales bacterium]